MKFASLLLLLICLNFSALAKNDDSAVVRKEHKNSIATSLLGFSFPRTYKYHSHLDEITNWDLIDVFGLSYERTIWKNFSLGIAYNAWDNHPELREISGSSVYAPLEAAGSWEYMQRYKMYDLYLSYKYDHFKRHKISAGIGISYAKGQNIFIDTTYLIYAPGFPHGETIVHQQDNKYWGSLCYVNYDYTFWMDRFSIGYKILWRLYQKWYSSELDYGFTVKFNF